MRLFSKSFGSYLKAYSIGSWEELHDVFLKYWGKNKSYDQFLSEFYSLKREKDEPIVGYYSADPGLLVMYQQYP